MIAIHNRDFAIILRGELCINYFSTYGGICDEQGYTTNASVEQ